MKHESPARLRHIKLRGSLDYLSAGFWVLYLGMIIGVSTTILKLLP